MGRQLILRVLNHLTIGLAVAYLVLGRVKHHWVLLLILFFHWDEHRVTFLLELVHFRCTIAVFTDDNLRYVRLRVYRSIHAVWLMNIIHVDCVVLIRGVSQSGLLSVDHYHIAFRFVSYPRHCCPYTPIVNRNDTVGRDFIVCLLDDLLGDHLVVIGSA